MVHGHHYGTSAEFVESTIRAGKHVLLDLDVQGALSLRSTVFRTVSVFLLPPSLQELERRLTARGTDSRETIELRLFNARKEIESVDRFDYLVINDDLNRAVEDTAYIIRAEECKTVGYPNIHDIFYGGSAC
jgi:guanylate kinase